MVLHVTSQEKLLDIAPEWMALVFGRRDDVSVYLCAVGREAKQTLFIPRRLNMNYMWELARHYGLDRRLRTWVKALPSPVSQDSLLAGCKPIDVAEYLDVERRFVYVLRSVNQPIYKILDYTDTVEWNFEPKPLRGIYLLKKIYFFRRLLCHCLSIGPILQRVCGAALE